MADIYAQSMVAKMWHCGGEERCRKGDYHGAVMFRRWNRGGSEE